jgi:hypothetical protein
MVRLKDLIEGNCELYGLFHATQTPVGELERSGLVPNQNGAAVLDSFISNLTSALREHLDAPFDSVHGVRNDYYPLEMSLGEQLARTRLGYAGVILALDEWDAVTLAGSSSEPERRAKALRSFAEEKEPGLLERLKEGAGGEDIRAALELLDSKSLAPIVFLRLVKFPTEGYFALLARPDSPVTDLLRLTRRDSPRPEARAILFNGVIPFSCFEVIPGPLKSRRSNRIV